MKVAVGSGNPTKIRAVERVMKTFWPDAEVVGVSVPSGVSDQPSSEDEAVEGALNRARASIEAMGVDMGVGIEGYTSDTKHGMFLSPIVVVVDSQGRKGVGHGGRFLLPEGVAAEVRKGRELGPVMDEFIGEHNVKQRQGAVGVFTKGRISRTELSENAVILALVRFLNPEHYE